VIENVFRHARVTVLSSVRSVAWTALAVMIALISAAGLATPAPAKAQVQAPSAAAAIAARATRLRLHAWRYVLAQIGKPYIWGGTGPFGFDCSGLVYAAYRAAGMTLPRTTYEMLASRILIRIPKSQARRGDLAFFGTGHVEMFDHGLWTVGALHSGTDVGFHLMNAYWHPTMYFRIRVDQLCSRRPGVQGRRAGNYSHG
jgi:cell wall-associated NlpC family hydrolase